MTAIMVALTAEQVEGLNLPPIMSAKASGSHYERFVEEYGETVYELESVPAAELQRILEDAIETVPDVAAFNHEIETEKKDAAYLTAARRAMQETLSKLEIPPPERGPNE